MSLNFSSFRNLRKFRTTLGTVEQAQLVISITVIVSLVTILTVRRTSAHSIDLLLFGSVLTVGIFGFMIVYFTLRYGRLLEEQKQELLALNTFAESVNRAIDMQYLLQTALHEVMRLLDIEYGWIYRVDGSHFILSATKGTEELDLSIVNTALDIHHKQLDWCRSPRIAKLPKHSSVHAVWEFVPLESWASVPIMTKDQLSGLIVAASKNSSAFSHKQIDLMAAFANQIGIAMENAMLFERVRKSEERYVDLFENSPDMSHIVDQEGIIISCNQTEANRLGYRKDELVGHSVLKLYTTEYHPKVKQLLREMFEQNWELKGIEERFLMRNGDPVDVSVNASIMRDVKGTMFIRSVARDISEKKKLEDKIIHAQRIDSIGNLAGGISHDFNNILTSILGSTAIMKRKMKRDDPWYRFVDIIETAAKRGAGLTRQLLAFARKGATEFRPIVVNDIIEETLRLFERSTDKSITLHKEFTNAVCLINGDDGQLQQSLLNILINARDAMPEGGTISIQSAKVRFDESNTVPEVRPGEYAVITIRDTGIGMSHDTLQHIFEPFYTTKDQGKGTGLGLSVVYGVVNSHNGFITVHSDLGHGAIFTLHFPLLPVTEIPKRASRTTTLKHGTEHILVVDDEKEVGTVISGMLNDLGYRVMVVDSGRKAVALYKTGSRFDIVILDMNMPKMSGKDTFIKLKEIDNHIRVIISTGYSNRSIDTTQLRDDVSGFLQKPYQLEELSSILRIVLDKK
jgi:PAS domain S-box-containing protein